MSEMTLPIVGRCPTCLRAGLWLKPNIVAAIQNWHKKRGYLPSASNWRKASPAHPSEKTVRTQFGSWSAAIRAAGFEPRRACRTRQWSEKQMFQALFEWRHLNGRLPLAREWRVSTPEHPSYVQIVVAFGSWANFFEDAGYARPKKSKARIAA